jgi:hypothetical protein
MHTSNKKITIPNLAEMLMKKENVDIHEELCGRCGGKGSYNTTLIMEAYPFQISSLGNQPIRSTCNLCFGNQIYPVVTFNVSDAKYIYSRPFNASTGLPGNKLDFEVNDMKGNMNYFNGLIGSEFKKKDTSIRFSPLHGFVIDGEYTNKPPSGIENFLENLAKELAALSKLDFKLQRKWKIQRE